MNRKTPHQITRCSICPHTGEACHIGFELARKLCQSISAGGDMISDDFEITGHIELVGCMRPCTAAFHATKKACHMFGDVIEGADVDALLLDTSAAAAITLEQGGMPMM
ncbi:hypothetical protein [uncultured Shimia sp.]|uniref:hypothetical protein n=1 Tax=uncultured Shimia sp. TaxID=573152 RepID=UPI0026178605|nr:hypothetical protein [uncultured Shimia sp.]